MHDEHPHDLLAQVPLTVSPFLALPAATTLPYTYKQLPSTLPPSITDATSARSNDPRASPAAVPGDSTGDTQPSEPAAYIHPPHGGPATHPAALLKACERLKAHIMEREMESSVRVKEWQRSIRARELAEKRRVAPGWLDAEMRMLVPTKKDGVMGEDSTDGAARIDERPQQEVADTDKEGEELDRAFGGMDLR